MQYHKAAFLGKERAKIAQLKLFDYTGFAMLTYTIKQKGNNFLPVGEEILVAKMVKGYEAMIFLCDEDGYAKAQSKPLLKEKADEIYKVMIADGFTQYKGDIKTIS